MSLRARTSAIVLAAAACLLLAPTAMASARGPVQVTGKQLKSALLPASAFVSGYVTLGQDNSGASLEHSTVYRVPSISCTTFWAEIGIVPGFGETAFAGDLVGSKSLTASPLEVFEQSVYQFASSHAASSFFGQLNKKYRSCRSVHVADPKGGTMHWTVRSQSTWHVGGHPALRIAENLSVSTNPASPTRIAVLWTIDGPDVYLIDTTMLSTTIPKPTQSSLTLKLIARVAALH